MNLWKSTAYIPGGGGRDSGISQSDIASIRGGCLSWHTCATACCGDGRRHRRVCKPEAADGACAGVCERERGSEREKGKERESKREQTSGSQRGSGCSNGETDRYHY